MPLKYLSRSVIVSKHEPPCHGKALGSDLPLPAPCPSSQSLIFDSPVIDRSRYLPWVNC